MYHLFCFRDITHLHIQCMCECRDAFTYETGGVMGWYLNIPPLFHLCDITHSYMQCMCGCRDSFNNDETGGVMGRYLNVPSPSSRVLMVKAPPRYQWIAPHCNLLQHTATYCITLHHAVTNWNKLYILQSTATHCNMLHYTTRQHLRAGSSRWRHHQGMNVSPLAATHCNTLQRTASLCITLKHTATRCNTLQHTARHRLGARSWWWRHHQGINESRPTASPCNTLQHTATNCNTMQHMAAHCSTWWDMATHCNTLQHTVTQSNTLQCAATHCLPP